MADLYLERIGLVNPTIVERDNNGKIERLESRGLDMASLVAFWRKCFDLDGLLFEKIILHCKSKDFNAMGGRALATVRSVRELLAEQGVECVIDDEWFKGKEESDYEQKLIATEELRGDACPICGYLFGECQCRYGGSGHPNRSKRREVVLDHLYLLNDRQLKHVINLEKSWRTSYSDNEREQIIKKLGWENKI